MSTGDDFELSRRKTLAGIGGIGVASAGAGLGTTAYFADEETIEDNQLIAGELDLRIDWQQKYFGPEENGDHYAPYGPAGYPFVNAHPDHDGNGEQSLDSDELGFNDGVVRYSDNDRNIQEYLTCETLPNFDPGDFDTDTRSQDSLIELEDVKPGDCGEVTFSYHLCDNPGYVWFLGELAEVDPELADAIEVQLWYDLDCTNEVDEEDTVIFEWGSLSEILNGSVQLNRTQYERLVESYGTHATDEPDDPTNGCPFLGKIEYEGSEFVPENGGSVLDPDEFGAGYDYAIELGFEGGSIRVGITVTATDDGDPRYVDAELIDGDIGGWCRVDVKGGPDTNTFGFEEPCVGEAAGLFAPLNPGGNRPTISNIEFYACPSDSDPPDPGPPQVPGECFPADETFCIGFEWCLPVGTEIEGINDVNDLQGKTIAFDLGFYTEQCRHNDDPSGPPSS